MFKRIPPIVIVLLCLAVVGFVVQFLSDPIHMLIVIGMTVLLLFVVNNYLKTGRFLPRFTASKGKTMKQSAKQGRMQVKKNSKPARKHSKFQVIEGSKGKNKANSSDKDSKMF